MKKNILAKKESGFIILIVMIFVLVIVIGAYLANIINNKTLTKEEATKIAQTVYEEAYSEIGEGTNLIKDSTIYYKFSSENRRLECNMLDFSNIDSLFTKKGLYNIENNYADSFLDGYYYCSWSEGDYMFHSKVEKFMSTIFGVTDQGIRDLTVVSVTSDTILATGTLFDNTYPFYIIFKKDSNNKWLIDSFE